MMIFSLIAMIGLEKCCIISGYLQWLCHSGERAVAHGPLAFIRYFSVVYTASPGELIYFSESWPYSLPIGNPTFQRNLAKLWHT